MGTDQLRMCPSSKDQAEGVMEGTEGEGYSGGQGFWWEMVPKSTTLPVAALGLGGRAGSLPNALSVANLLGCLSI